MEGSPLPSPYIVPRRRVREESRARIPALDYETQIWWKGAVLAGGTFEPNSIAVADGLIRAIKRSSFNSKLVWLLPLLGGNLATARMPLRDSLGVGIAGNTGNTDGNFQQSIGLAGDGTSRILDSLIKPSQLGASNNGGLGYWETNIAFDGTTIYLPMGCQNTAGTNYFSLGAWSSYQGLIYWGLPANQAGLLTGTATNGNYYGQRSSATSREIFKNGSSIATNTTSDATSGAGDNNVYVMGFNQSGTKLYFHGRCACAYMTDGTLTAQEVADFDTLLRLYLFRPTLRATA